RRWHRLQRSLPYAEELEKLIMPAAPVFAPIGNQFATESTAVSVSASASGTNPIAYSLDSTPAGASINSSTGVFTWTPPPTDAVAWWRAEGNAVDVAGLNHGT